MKYLLINTMGEAFTMISDEERIKVINGSGAFFDRCRKSGILKDIWVVPNLKKNISIWEVDTPEDIDKLFMQNPVAPYENAELYLLADWDAHERSAKETFG
jgi:muconolactone delta-isomerase